MHLTLFVCELFESLTEVTLEHRNFQFHGLAD